MTTTTLHAHSWPGFRLWDEELKPDDTKVHRGKGRKLARSKPWQIVFDPLPVEDGGFSSGAVIETVDLIYMLYQGNLSFGAKLERLGMTYTVIDGGRLVDQNQKIWWANTARHILEAVK